MPRRKNESNQQLSVAEGRKSLRDVFLKPFKRDNRSRSPSCSLVVSSSSTLGQSTQSFLQEAVEGKPNAVEQQRTENSTPRQVEPIGEGLIPDAQWENNSTPHEPCHVNVPTEPDKQISLNLWVEAYKRLSEEHKKIFAGCGINISANAVQGGFLDEILNTAKKAREKAEANSWKFKFGGVEIDLSQKAQAMIRWIEKFKNVGDIAVQYDPIHAALPWAGVRFILQVIVDSQVSMEAAVIGIARITMLISRCTIYEQLYLTTEEASIQARNARNNLSDALINLYVAILSLLSSFIQCFMSNTGKNILNSIIRPGAVWEKVQALNEPESTVNTEAGRVENCYQAESRHFQKEQFKNLKLLLKSFETTLDQVNTTVAQIYKGIEGTERIKILEWFSKVRYRSHHDIARKDRVEGTGQWLFGREEGQGGRREFRTWMESKHSEVLWLHGIPGSGKTKLVSAIIDHLQPIVDKVTYFYCKRDEAVRRDIQQILLALVKQLACPDSERICALAQEAYEKEQKDPSSRAHLPLDETINLLTKLAECYQHPVIILDALDECPQASIGSILDAFFTMVKNSNASVKVLVSSRHSLDIETHMQNVPHVSIEARDNAEDIENYVETELESRINAMKLLRGRVSRNLREKIKEVLLRDANGMFLWVDYQLKELCNLYFEEDVLERLGKLPKNLTEVYHEIMISIESQPGRARVFAERALKWMLVSCRLLSPNELCAAAQIDSTLPIAQPREGTETTSAFEIDLLLGFCRGLLILDNSLHLTVVRFAHLSVQEYLETNNPGWNILDAQLHVTEACLWSLQNVHSDSSQETSRLGNDSDSIYYYSASYWFKHCRSYQSLVMPLTNTAATALRYPPELKLLHSFLGSFNQPSKAYVTWVKWIPYKWDSWDELERIRRSMKSTPLRPIFAAAIAGLGELVKYLWASEDIKLDLRNNSGESLLYLAAMSGEVWTVKQMLDRGADANTVGCSYGTALSAAAYYGYKEIVTLLLDRGADANTVGGRYGIALGSAAFRGHKEIVKLLLDRGANVNIVDGSYGTALGAAAFRGHKEIVKLLLDRGADVNIVDGSYGTALGAAAFRGHKEIVKLLLDRGTDVNIVDGSYGTALGAAASEGQKEIVTLLLDQGADANAVGGVYGTALGVAAFRRDKEIVTLLLDRGADVSTVGGTLGTALGVAVYCAYEEIVTLLLDRGADVNTMGGSYETALWVAASRGHKEIVTLLLERGADANIVCGLCGTALGAAASGGYKGIVTLLLDRGADANIVCGLYGTALGIAAFRGHQEIVTLLLDRGADPFPPLPGRLPSPLTLATEGGHDDIVELLESKRINSTANQGPSAVDPLEA